MKPLKKIKTENSEWRKGRGEKNYHNVEIENTNYEIPNMMMMLKGKT